MKTNFKFQRNGWSLVMHLNIPIQKITSANIINVSFDIVGLCIGEGIIDLAKNVLVSEKEIEIKPYVDNNKIIYGNTIKIPKETIKQIKSYLE